MMNFKVIKYINSKNILCSRFTKNYSSNVVEGVNVLQQLKKRALVKVEGEEVTPYLQGLMTNDMKHLQEKPTSMYALFLNTKGRVLYDSIIYSTTSTNSYLIECDSSVLNQFLKHLKIFRVKKKIDISTHPSKVWVLFNDSLMDKLNFNNTDLENIKLYQKAKLEIDKNDKYQFYKDPRMSLLGLRIISDTSLNEDSLRPLLGHADVKISQDDNYRKFRYCLGVGEGVSDLPQGNCFPLEANADYLHGVSFHKGCYIGQELTARTHHTGVVRKRLMPLLFQEDTQQEEIEQESPIFGTESGKTSVGKVRGVANNVGLGLLRVAHVTLEPQLNVSGKKARTYKPLWWPEEAPKEKVSVG